MRNTTNGKIKIGTEELSNVNSSNIKQVKVDGSSVKYTTDNITWKEVGSGGSQPEIVNTYSYPLVVENNKIYDLGVVSEAIYLSFSGVIDATFCVELDFSTQNILPTMSYTKDVKFAGDDVVNSVFVPSVYKEYTIIFTYNNGGLKGIVCAF